MYQYGPLNNKKICVRVEHAFAALKGCFQSLHELRLKVAKDKDLHVAVYWITCCMILHNMIIHFEANQQDEFGDGMMDWEIDKTEGWEEDEGDWDGEQHQEKYICLDLS